jgi:hypothetical protein
MSGMVKVDGKVFSGRQGIRSGAEMVVMAGSMGLIERGSDLSLRLGPGKYRLTSRDRLEIVGGQVTGRVESIAGGSPFSILTKPAVIEMENAGFAILVDGATGNFPAQTDVCVARGVVSVHASAGKGEALPVTAGYELSVKDGIPVAGSPALNAARAARVESEILSRPSSPGVAP